LCIPLVLYVGISLVGSLFMYVCSYAFLYVGTCFVMYVFMYVNMLFVRYVFMCGFYVLCYCVISLVRYVCMSPLISLARQFVRSLCMYVFL